MKESYIEGVATRDDPESCARVREGTGEAFDRGTCGPGIEPRNHTFQDADVVNPDGRQRARHRYREMHDGPARSKTLCTHGTFLHENREVSGFSDVARRGASGRP
jgi:hypothetical protein